MDDRFSWILPMAIFALTSCGTGANQQQTPVTSYRDLKGYFKQELAFISQHKPVLYKTVTLNNQRDSVTINAPDSAQLQNLLQPFLEIDLNKPSLRDAYDTISLADQFTGKRSLLYKARNKITLPQEVILNINNTQQIENVQLNKHVLNLIYEYQQHLEYQHNKHIRITTWQKIAFLPSKELDVKILLRSNN
ncbi:hypothetical protein SAMN05518672_1011507 [Chitinophaga sp. CF118]|uniref:hypothetical protein n=1 Tax=Chitinophaga sp. CF118 TaxID=1884367 RepID=UPI0008EB73FB|nr:hypothetical protein [Chitinophaga sp. CF118]SFD29882.1 hypothetical protein SAMN05518672_1011507 [Chitinophaga sp. CF118]